MQHVFVVRFHFIVEIGERFVGCVCVNWTIFAVSMFFVQVFCRLLLLSLGHCHCVVRLSVEMNVGCVYVCVYVCVEC